MAVISSLPPHFAISDSLALQKHVPSDAEAIFTMLERTPDIPKHVAFAKDITRLDDVLPSLQSRSNEAIDGRYAIMAHYTLVGSVWAFPGSEEREFGIGYCLDHAARGNGYATQAATTMVKQLQLLGANEIYFQIITGNTDSIAIPERLGCKPAEMIIGTDFPVEQQRWRLQLKA
ncbi:MAG: hypothetical protein JWL89_365 [Candidatus Saccharibacteria bacterium]|nr:hypothetical protein [Candidatus Saccharibacteria bacterium]